MSAIAFANGSGEAGSSKQAPVLLSQAAVILSALALWQLVATSDIVSEQSMAAPGPVLGRLVELAGTSGLWEAVGATLAGWAIGLGLALTIALPLGILLGRSPFAFRSSRFVVDFLRTIPALGIIPLAALLFGTSRTTELVVVVPACVFPLLLQTIYGVRDVDPSVLETARSLRITFGDTMRRVIIPSATPFVATGLRIAAVMAMLLAISVELLVLVPGVGRELARAQQNGAVVDVYAYTLIAGLMGYLVVLGFSSLERRVIHWHPSQRRSA